jgi:hypothetical protein
MIAKNAKRLILVVGLALLAPGVAGAAGVGSVEPSFWGELADSTALFSRAWERLASLWTGGGSIDPNGEGTNGGASIDPNGGVNGSGACVGDCGASIDPNG